MKSTGKVYTRSQQLHGKRGACLQVLQKLWLDILEQNDSEIASCPIIGLFDDNVSRNTSLRVASRGKSRSPSRRRLF